MTILISNSDGKPIYEQIVEQMRTAIISGELEPGERLPSMRTLAGELRVSIITTKRAFDELEKEGFIQSFTGKGSFVAERNTEKIREAQMRRIEEKILEAIVIAKGAGIQKEEIKEILDVLYDGGVDEA